MTYRPSDGSTLCPHCRAPFTPSTKQIYCSARCRKQSHAKRSGTYSGASHRTGSRRTIIGLDGEGIGLDYVMLLASDGSGIIDRGGLSTERCLTYLTSLPRTALLWSFAFGYDVNMILADWPPEVLAELWDSITAPDGTCTVAYRGWRVRWVPGKVFAVTNTRTGERATVWDVWPYVQTSFVEWLAGDSVTDPGELAAVAAMKERRDSLASVSTDTIADYCRTETRLLAAGVARLLALFRSTGINPTSYYGPGSLAASLMREHGVADHIAPPPRRYRAAVHAAYRGGRFENSITGWQRAGWRIDINSAYPAAAAALPCLAHAEWVHRSGPPMARVALCRVAWSTDSRVPWGPFPVKSASGATSYPTNGTGWYWSPEVRAASAAFPGLVSVVESVELAEQCAHRPFAFLHGLYRERLRLKSANDPRQQVLKLAANAVYGKLAQHTGASPFRSLVWAGLITSTVRGQLLDAMRGAPDNVTMIATDGLTVRTLPDTLTYGDGLGEWSADRFTDMLVLQPGLYYYTDHGGTTVTRSRGFGHADLPYARAAAAMPQDVTPTAADFVLGRIHATVRRFVGLGETVRRGDWERWRAWEDRQVSVSLNPWPRRGAIELTPDGITTYAPVSVADVRSADYRGSTLERIAGMG